MDLSYKSIHRCASVRMDTLTSRTPNPELKTLSKIIGYLLHTGRMAVRLHALCRAVVRSQREGKDVVIRLHTPDTPLRPDEELLVIHRADRLSASDHRHRHTVLHAARRYRRPMQ